MRPTLYRPALMHFERATPIMLQRPMILFTLLRGGPPPPPAAPPREVPPPFRNFFLEFAPENYAIEYDENRMQRGGRGLVCTNRSDGMGTYVTLPLELIQVTVDGLLNLELSALGHGYFDLTTTDKFWPVLRERTDLF
jgi:hypothetical protein